MSWNNKYENNSAKGEKKKKRINKFWSQKKVYMSLKHLNNLFFIFLSGYNPKYQYSLFKINLIWICIEDILFWIINYLAECLIYFHIMASSFVFL